MTGDQGKDRPDSVWRLGGEMHRELAAHTVKVGHAPARLDRCHMDARDVHIR